MHLIASQATRTSLDWLTLFSSVVQHCYNRNQSLRYSGRLIQSRSLSLSLSLYIYIYIYVEENGFEFWEKKNYQRNSRLQQKHKKLNILKNFITSNEFVIY